MENPRLRVGWGASRGGGQPHPPLSHDQAWRNGLRDLSNGVGAAAVAVPRSRRRAPTAEAANAETSSYAGVGGAEQPGWGASLGWAEAAEREWARLREGFAGPESHGEDEREQSNTAAAAASSSGAVGDVLRECSPSRSNAERCLPNTIAGTANAAGAGSSSSSSSMLTSKERTVVLRRPPPSPPAQRHRGSTGRWAAADEAVRVVHTSRVVLAAPPPSSSSFRGGAGSSGSGTNVGEEAESVQPSRQCRFLVSTTMQREPLATHGAEPARGEGGPSGRSAASDDGGGGTWLGSRPVSQNG